MGIPALILGASGAGKSASLRNFKPDDIGIFNVAGKPLPFKNKLPMLNNAGYDIIKKTLAANKKKTYVIDDSQYLMAFYMFSKAKIKGYDKFTDCALDFYSLIRCAVEQTTPDTIVYFLHHTETADDGRLKAKTQGKMLDNQLTVEGLFSIVLLATKEQQGHCFITQTDGNTPVKAPMGMFEDARIDNDLAAVDKAIRAYYSDENKDVEYEEETKC